MANNEVKISKIPTAKFLFESGLLFEINRSILHPFGLALEVRIEDVPLESTDPLGLDVDDSSKEQVITLGDLWDYRDDPEGMLFAEESFQEGLVKFNNFMQAFGKAKLEQRKELLGFIKQTSEVPADRVIAPTVTKPKEEVPKEDKPHKFLVSSNVSIKELENTLKTAGVSSPTVNVFKNADALGDPDAEEARRTREKYLEEGSHKSRSGQGMCKDPSPVKAKIPRGGTQVFCSTCGYIYFDSDLEV